MKNNTVTTPFLKQEEQLHIVHTFRYKIAVLLAQHHQISCSKEPVTMVFIKRKATLLRYDLSRSLKQSEAFNARNALYLDRYSRVLNRFIDRKLFVPRSSLTATNGF